MGTVFVKILIFQRLLLDGGSSFRASLLYWVNLLDNLSLLGHRPRR